MRLLIPLLSPKSIAWGRLTRGLAIAKAAQAAGHEVAFCASGQLAHRLLEAGQRVYPTPAAQFLGLPPIIARLFERRTQEAVLPVRPGISVGSIWGVLFALGMARASYLRASIDAELQAVRKFHANVLFTDLDPGAYLIASITGIPLASAYQSILEHGVGTLPYKRFNRITSRLLKDYNRPAKPPEILFFGPRTFKIIPSIPELDGADPDRPDLCYVGRLLGEINPEAADELALVPDRRYVYVYVGSNSVTLKRLRNVLPQVFKGGEGIRCIVGVPSLTANEQIAGVEFRPNVYADRLLPQCDWTICHGGQNTVIQSLSHGVPLLIFPGPLFERRFHARKIQEVGAGRFGEVYHFSPRWLAEALQVNSDVVAVANTLRERICSYGGAKAAVEELENLS
jgi:UDP:flavonoid glycosyltransferase YjiC (YdhE family)